MKKELLLIMLLLSGCQVNFNSSNNSNISNIESSVSSYSLEYSSSLDESSSSNETKIDIELYDDNINSPYGKLIKNNSTFTYKLPSYQEVISSDQELIYALEYLAFYQVRDFSLNLNRDYKNSIASNFDNFSNYLYWSTNNINGVMGMDLKLDGNDIKGKFYHYDYGSKTAAQVNSYEHFNNLDYAQNDYSNLDYEIEYHHNGHEVEVYNTQQLYYAMERDFLPLVIKDSPAERYLNEAKSVVKSLIKDDMSELERVRAIYDYIIYNSWYDYAALDYSNSSNPLFPDMECAYYDCYFLEGFFNNKRVVCDSFAKTYMVLASLAGIDIHRACGGNGDYSTRAVPGHAYCYVKVDGTWYLSCPTWATAVYNVYETSYGFIHHNYFLTTKSVMQDYASNMYPDIQMNNKYVFKENETFSVNGETFNRLVTSKDEAKKIVDLFDNTSKATIEICCTDESIRRYFENYAYGMLEFGDFIILYRL